MHVFAPTIDSFPFHPRPGWKNIFSDDVIWEWNVPQSRILCHLSSYSLPFKLLYIPKNRERRELNLRCEWVLACTIIYLRGDGPYLSIYLNNFTQIPAVHVNVIFNKLLVKVNVTWCSVPLLEVKEFSC